MYSRSPIEIHCKGKISKKEVSICKMYWKMRLFDDWFEFVHELEDISRDQKCKINNITNIVQDRCYATYSALNCSKCEQPLRLETREDLGDLSLVPHRLSTPQLCGNCGGKKKPRGRTDRRQYEELSPLDISLLTALVHTEDIFSAERQVGLSHELAARRWDELIKSYYISADGSYEVHPDLKHWLDNQNPQQLVKSVFGSPNAKALYFALWFAFSSDRNTFVFPEIPLCAFIREETIEHLFTGNWHKNYFLTARLDIVLCDSEGIPKYAIEYQGSYHQNADMRQKDAFKKAILEEVGIPLREMTYEDMPAVHEALVNSNIERFFKRAIL